MARKLQTAQEKELPPGTMEHIEWIVLSKDSHSDRKKMLSKIRSHAMRATAASRKKSGTWGKHNLRQYPVPSPSVIGCTASDFSEVVTDKSSDDKGSESHSPEKEILGNCESRPLGDDLAFKLRLELSMPLSGLDQLTAEIGLNVLDLSALTTVHIGQRATSFLANQPSRLVDLVSCRKLSYLAHVPTRYGYSYCLDDAVRCVTTKARRVLVGSGKGGCTMELALYGKALRSLQSAIDLEQGWRNPDVLCAIQVLSLYEVCISFSNSSRPST
jgi:hypothetical protein